MTILQMKAEIEDIDKQINTLTKTREELRMKIAKRVCPHKPGDRFRSAAEAAGAKANRTFCRKLIKLLEGK